MNDFDIDYNSINSRQEFLSIYYLYFYMIQYNRYSFDIGNFIIALLSYMVENGRLDFYSMTTNDIKNFTNKYFFNLNMQNVLSNDDLNNILNKLEGINSDGTPIMYKYSNKSEKVAYILFDIENNGYKITDTGLQFLISSKEVPQESKLTVSLYLFRLQIKKHKYQSALDTIVNINMETKRQLSIKNKILHIAKYDAQLGNKMYNDYWKDFVSLRLEEEQHYQQAKEFLKEYQNLSQEDITSSDKGLLRKIDAELNLSTTLQNQYILEISSMGKEMTELSLNSINNVFENKFNFKEHFEDAYKSKNPINSLMTIITPLLLPKKIKLFDVSMAFAQQQVKTKNDIQTIGTVANIKEPISIIDVSKQYENRKLKNYQKYFTIMISMLEKSSIDDIREYIKQFNSEDIQSIDFLSYLMDLSSFSELNTSLENNRQIIHLKDKSNGITCSTFEDVLSTFWFRNLKQSKSADIYVCTNVKDVIFLDKSKHRSIGNIRLELHFLEV
ncbi:MAG: hypothetical protein ACI4WH_05825 [Oscillospiraceae bacterium]